MTSPLRHILVLTLDCLHEVQHLFDGETSSAMHNMKPYVASIPHWGAHSPFTSPWATRISLLTGCTAPIEEYGASDLQENIFSCLNAHQKDWRVYFHDISSTILLPVSWRPSGLARHQFVNRLWYDLKGAEETFPSLAWIEPSYYEDDINDAHDSTSVVHAQRLIAQIWGSLVENTDLWNASLLLIVSSRSPGAVAISPRVLPATYDLRLRPESLGRYLCDLLGIPSPMERHEPTSPSLSNLLTGSVSPRRPNKIHFDSTTPIQNPATSSNSHHDLVHTFRSFCRMGLYGLQRHQDLASFTNEQMIEFFHEHQGRYSVSNPDAGNYDAHQLLWSSEPFKTATPVVAIPEETNPGPLYLSIIIVSVAILLLVVVGNRTV